MSAQTFQQLVARLNAGDATAIERLVSEYQPVLRRQIRFRMRDPRLNRLFDSMDFCQAVMASFFLRATSGRLELHSPGDIRHLLLVIAHRKLAAAVRGQYRQRRDMRRGVFDQAAIEKLVDPHPTPSSQAEHQEQVERAWALLSAEERELAELRRAGRGWKEIVLRVGGTPQARRMQFVRALDRARRELGLAHDD